jgi:hypothetical protein
MAVIMRIAAAHPTRSPDRERESESITGSFCISDLPTPDDSLFLWPASIKLIHRITLSTAIYFLFISY